MYRHSLFLPALGIAAAAVAPSSFAAVINGDARLVTSGELIDPAGAQEVDTNAPGSTPQATLEAIAGAQALQNFDGFAGPAVNFSPGFNTVFFSDPTLPDLMFTAAGNTRAQSGATVGSDTFVTSDGGNSEGGVDLRAAQGSGTNITYTVDFGSYDAGSDTFVSDVNSVTAAGFTLGAIRQGKSYTVEFRDDSGAVLSTQTLAGITEVIGDPGSDPNDGTNTQSEAIDGYFGFQALAGQSIGSILITQSATSNGNQTSAFDDLLFTDVVPEPASLALVGLGGLLMLRRNRG